MRCVVILVEWMLLPALAYFSPNLAEWLSSSLSAAWSPAAWFFALHGGVFCIFVLRLAVAMYLGSEAGADVGRVLIPGNMAEVEDLLSSWEVLHVLSVLPWIVGTILVLRASALAGPGELSWQALQAIFAGRLTIPSATLICGAGWIGVGAFICRANLVISPVAAIQSGIKVLIELLRR